MSSSATGVGMPICFLGAILLILTQKSSQKFGDVLGIKKHLFQYEYLRFMITARNHRCLPLHQVVHSRQELCEQAACRDRSHGR